MSSNGFPGLSSIRSARQRVRPEAVPERPERKTEARASLAARENDLIRKTTRDTIKLLAFAQIALVFCAGAIPSPVSFLAFLPGFALLGAALFQVLWLVVRSFEPMAHLSDVPTSSQPVPPPQTHPESRVPEQVVSISRIA